MQRYDGGFAQIPLAESHGGSTYCAIASLALCGALKDCASSLGDTLDWLVHRQLPLTGVIDANEGSDDEADPGGGHQGRPHKDEDACYSFWITASIRVRALSQPVGPALIAAQLLAPGLAAPDAEAMQTYLLACQDDRMGGIASTPGGLPGAWHPVPFVSTTGKPRADVYHTYLALAGLSLGGLSPDLAPHDPALNVSSAVLARLPPGPRAT
jgi:geranylgeranyl transferase type-1 subunit beta